MAFQNQMNSKTFSFNRFTLYGADEPGSIITRNEEEVRAAMKIGREVPNPILEELLANSKKDMKTAQLFDAGSLDATFLESLTAKRSYYSIVAERLMQTLDDYQLSDQIKKSNEIAMRSSDYTADTKPGQGVKEKLVVLGTGWGSHAFLKTIDATKYDVKVISPRNYFMFTPMLAASTVGTVEFRSICEPIRNVNPFADYLEAAAVSIDSEKKTIQCTSIKCEGVSCDVTDFDVEYDHLLVAVGATTNTFGIKGVREYCHFLKQIEDAAGLRKSIANCFERANIPGLSNQEVLDILSFVVVGAGPTGVEFTSELRDWLENEGRKYYPKLLKYVRISLVEAGNAVLAVFDETLQAEALVRLTERETDLVKDGFIAKEMTTVILRAGVKEIGEKIITLANNQTLAYGFCVWAAGNGPIPLVLDVVDKVPGQKEFQAKARGRVVTDNWLRVLGAEGVYSIGDCAMMQDSPLPATAQVASQQGSYLGRLFSKGFDMSPHHSLPSSNVIFNPPVDSHADADAKAQNTPVAPTDVTHADASLQALIPPFRIPWKVRTEVDVGDTPAYPSDKIKLGRLTFKGAAPVMRKVYESGEVEEVVVEYAKPFQFLNLGVLAYVGASQALAQVSVNGNDKAILGSGPIGFLLWRGIYWSKQVSWRNRILVGLDWVKGRVFGRDIGIL